MAESIYFETVHRYSAFSVGISVPTTLLSGDQTAELVAKIDTGSTYCVFQRLHGELLGLDVGSGLRIEIATPTGSFSVYGHELVIEVLGFETVSTVYFAESEFFDRNVLGRVGWIDRVKLGLIEAESALYLSQYTKEFA